MRERWRHASAEDRLLLVGLPVLVAVLLGGWSLWLGIAPLDDVEARTLNWPSVLTLAGQHLRLVLVCSAIVMLTAVPLGIALTRRRAGAVAPVAMGLANMGQAAPVIGVIVLLALLLGFGFWVAVLALSVYGFLPVLANTVAGLRGVDPHVVESARGMGMSPRQVLLRVELPLAVPVIMSGVRTALVLMVGAGAFATFIDAGGLGLLIQTGIVMFRYSILVSGALLVACLALAVEWAGRVVELFAAPRGIA
ncbi:ABC transporter permease [Micrococcus sp.]|uniref:ABC transporter permease n=1 Tax=Micrococcus sp. TaxID=1271 RepID=UPI002A914F63|nr:ABC transporter permease [Micrococcus sp.]MDY6054604.1 ABC transporter permease [Micrococcus sp.]